MSRPSTIHLLLGAVLLAVSFAASGQSRNGFDLSSSSVPLNEILSGGPPREGIPAIDRPKFVAANKADFLTADDRLLGVRRNGIAKAYPIRILNWHEIVNDEFAGESVVISFCPLCATGTAFSTARGTARTFGVSGLLYNSDLLLYDRQTESLWSQILGEAITGRLHGETMAMIAVEHTTWADWRTRHPRTLVLSTDTGTWRDYSRSPYAGYENSDGLYFPVGRLDPRYHPKEQVIGIEIDGHAKVYPFTELARAGGEVTDRVGGVNVVVRFNVDHRSARIENDDGELLPAVTGFWFAWMAFHPNSEVFTAGD